MSAPDSDRQRLDQWLYFARFFKTRSLAAQVVRTGKVRIGHRKAAKASATVSAGETLTFPQGGRIRVIEVLRPAARRGPAAEAAELYRDLTPPQPRLKTGKSTRPGRRPRGAGRPTKKQRRQIDRLKRGL